MGKREIFQQPMLLLMTLVLLLNVTNTNVSGDELRAFEFHFERRPLWIVSGAWSETGDRLFLLDNMRQEIIPIREDGLILDTISPSLEGTGFNTFNLLKRSNSSGKLHLDLDSLGVATLDQDLKVSPQKIARVAREGLPHNGPSHRIAAIHSWAIFGEYIFAFADVEQQSIPGWISGFLRIPIDNTENFEFLVDLKISLGDPMAAYYQIGLNLIEASSSSALILVMDDPPYLVAVDSGGKSRMVYVEAACGSRPEIPRIKGGIEALPAALSALERSEGPIGVYSHGDRVFLLCRRWVEERVQFSVAEIDMTTGAAVFLNPIDTQASHLVVVPGPRYWAIVQKGPVVANKNSGPFMPIKSALMIPTTEITNPGLLSVAQLTDQQDARIGDLIGKIWYEIRFAFSGIAIFLISFLSKKLRAFWRRTLKQVRYFFSNTWKILQNIGKRAKRTAIESSDKELASYGDQRQ